MPNVVLLAPTQVHVCRHFVENNLAQQLSIHMCTSAYMLALRHLCWHSRCCLSLTLCSQSDFIYFFTLCAYAAAAGAPPGFGIKLWIHLEVAKSFIIFTHRQTNGMTPIHRATYMEHTSKAARLPVPVSAVTEVTHH